MEEVGVGYCLDSAEAIVQFYRVRTRTTFTSDDCNNSCLQDPNCVGVSYRVGTGSCFIHTTEDSVPEDEPDAEWNGDNYSSALTIAGAGITPKYVCSKKAGN